VIVPNRFSNLQIKALVEHMASGQPAKDFDHTQVKRRSTVGSPQPTFAKATVDTSAGKSKAGNTTTTVENEPETPPSTPEQTPGQQLDEFIDKFRPRFNQMLVIGALLLGAWWFRGCWMEKLHLSMPTETSVSTPRRESPGGSRDAKPKTNEAGDVKNGNPSQVQTSPVRTSKAIKPLRLSTSKALIPSTKPVNPSPSTPPNLSSQPWNPDEEDLDSFYSEIFNWPRPFDVKPFAVQPDSAMTAEKAARYIGDLQDGEKYTVKVGHDTHKVLSAIPSSSGLSLAFQGSLGGLLGDNSKLEIYWEDVKAIHCNQVMVFSDPGKVFYQCTFLAKDLKKPLIIQCSGDANLKRLVTALVFQMQSANGGKTFPLSGIPYLFQGLMLNDSAEVIGLWDQSPADKSGIWLSQKVVNLDKDNYEQQGCDDLVKALDGLNPGQHVLLVDIPAEGSKPEEKKELMIVVP
jgi:hypothetical protein